MLADLTTLSGCHGDVLGIDSVGGHDHPSQLSL